ncbi:hypothetical protein ASG49_15775 [Marmoricola sp. Leaf446]|uniref:alpha-(1->3)-arabinofuranosyltransferase domain-containing protein n=1 Tax=Marmoricola sp. Leaf446 TaxID=1736379 RepID=UPI0007016437|nr:alpha-(1->3)-arabinofuranosyltransferase family protein [Marmoricola sp. Leaf446]KQT89248.1 hypothetical protein ASG49_15775 [Marmoricola sp. Leaf446]
MSAAAPAASRTAAGPTRLRLLAGCALLAGLAFVQSPGLLVADTKFDLAVDPGGFLARSLHLWDPAGTFGQLQNQAYGYLWPMGPFFWLGDVLGVPGWAVQRGWWALVLCVAFVGCSRLVQALGVRSDLATLLAAFAYALSPRMLTTIGPISIEAWPSAVAPWVLLPLVLGSRSGSPRRAAALSALAVAMVGGVNAAATFAVLPLGVVWLLTRSRGRRRRELLLWWPVFTLLGTLWWLVPLFTLGAYSPPFLDFIESSSITTFPTTLFDALRGTSNWVPYVSAESRAGNELLTQGYLAVNGAVLVGLGLAGIAWRRNPHRLFLSLSVLVGLLMVTAGHQGSVQGLGAAWLGDLLDGALAPLRNVHKFDPAVRLPLVVGLAVAVEGLWAGARAAGRGTAPRSERINRGIAVGVAMLSVVVAASPALATRLAPSNPVLEVPGYWRATAAWLDDNAQQGTTLLAPGSGFARYLWGTPRDEPLQYLTGVDWAVRNVIPLTPPGNIRMLDRIEAALAQGEGSAALVQYLQRAGVRHLVVRNDLVPGDDVPDPVLVHQALDDSPGVERVARFGPAVGSRAFLFDGETRLVVDGGWQREYPAVEVFEVPPGPAGRTGPPVVVAGGPEDLTDLLDLDVVGAGPTVLAADLPEDRVQASATAGLVLTDGLRARERDFARLHDGASPTSTPGDSRRTGNPRRDYLAAGQDRWSTRARLVGARSVSASSSASDAGAAGGSRRGQLPYAALDGDPTTEWTSDRAATGRDRWRLQLSTPRSVDEVRLIGGASGEPGTQLRVRTQGSVSALVSLDPGERRRVELDGGVTDWVGVETVGDTGGLALAEVEVDGLDVDRRLDLPALPEAAGPVDAVVLRPDLDPRTGCAEIDEQVRCRPDQAVASEEPGVAHRRVRLPVGAQYRPELSVTPRPGAALDALLSSAQPVNVTASSTGVADLRASAAAAVDGDPGTSWSADADDERPALSFGWLRPQRITGVRLSLPDTVPAARPLRVTLTWPDGERAVRLGEDGDARFPAIRVRQLRVSVDEVEAVEDLAASDDGRVGVGISEIRFDGEGLLPLRPSERVLDRGCGSGPAVGVGGVTRPSSVRASDAAIYRNEALPAVLCRPGAVLGTSPRGRTTGTVGLPPGATDVVLTPSSTFRARALVLRRDGWQPPAATASVVRRDGPVQVAAESSVPTGVLDLQQNVNSGWSATQDGRQLRPVTVDGWRQGFEVAGSGPVRARFAPDTTYRLGMAGGLLAALVLVGAVSWLLGVGRRGPGSRLPELRAATLPPVAGGTIAVLAGALLAGAPGAAVGLAVAVAGWLLPQTGRAVLLVVAGAPVMVASVAYLLLPWGQLGPWAGTLAWPHYLALTSVLAVPVAACRPGRQLRRRMAGRSTHL